MTATAERENVSQLAAESGWTQRDSHDRIDYFSRRPERVRVVWQGSEAISGGSLYRDGILMSLATDLDTVKRWLKR